jgi:predicted ATPase/class 3 adenylate cyclase
VRNSPRALTESTATASVARVLPTGTVTFMFTDIQGSTRLLQSLGDRYPGLLAKHHALIRQALEANDGIEANTEGDAFFAVFTSPKSAVAAAVQAQRSLAAEQWPDGVEVRVRMGLHTGQGIVDGGTYVGLDVHRAARISSAGHGGQVVLSDQSRVLVEGDLPAGIGLKDLGPHHLKDLDRPEHLYQLQIEGLAADFPPLRSVDLRPKSLPRPLTSLIGRERDIKAVRALLGDHRLVTILGPGGTGKTRLAIAVVEDGFAELSDGATFVELDAVKESALVASAIAHAAGVQETSKLSSLEVLSAHLAEQRLLLVLDNFEQVLDAASTVQTLLEAAPEIRVLVTSRAPLRLYGEQQYRLSPLDLPDLENMPPLEELGGYPAIGLFVDRASMASPTFSLTAANARAVTEIAARLDGMPLAIELAAARSNVFSPDAMLKRLERRLSVPSSVLAGVPERQRSLRGTIEWSYDQLAGPEQVLLRRLSVFGGGFTISAAETVCNADGAAGPDLLDPIGALVDNSLLRQANVADGEVRFGWLETIREFAAERLVESGERDDLARREAEHVLGLVLEAEPALVGMEQLVWLDRLTIEHDNVRSALRWASDDGDALLGLRIAAAIWRFWQLRGHIREGREWLSHLLARAAPDADPAILAPAHTAAGNLAYWQADTVDGRAHYERALELDKALENDARIADDVRNLGFVAMQEKNPRLAMEHFQESLSRWEAIGDRFQIAEAQASLGASTMILGDYQMGRDLMVSALPVYLERGALPRAADSSMGLSIVSVRLGDVAAAVAYARQAIDIAQRLGDPSRIPIVLDSAFEVAIAAGLQSEAVRLAAAAAHLRTSLGGTIPSYFRDPAEFLAVARNELGDETYERLWSEGAAFEPDAALAYALEVLPPAG